MDENTRARLLDTNIPPIVDAIDKAVENLIKELGEEGADTATVFFDIFSALVATMREAGLNMPQGCFDSAYVDSMGLNSEYDPEEFLALFSDQPTQEDKRFELPALATKNEQSN